MQEPEAPKTRSTTELINPRVRAFTSDASDDPEAFWSRAAEHTPWFRKWDSVFEWTPPTFRWFAGAECNLAYNCLDHHAERGWGGHAALICETEGGERRVLTYTQLLEDVKEIAASLRAIGVGRGDRVVVYMPPCAESIALMLAIVRIGAMHLVVFAGFGSGALADRIRMSGACAVFTADTARRKGRDLPLKRIVDEAVSTCGSVDRVVVLHRVQESSAKLNERELQWDQFLALGRGQSAAHEVMEANEPAFLLATSGTTAKPKLVVHAHGPYQVFIRSMGDWCFGLKQTDVWWATSDIGWIVGHSYMIYAPLLSGCTTVVFDGVLDYPGPETFYRLIEANGVSGVFTSPTAIRLLMGYGSRVARDYDLRSVERVVCAGEVLNPPAWEWLQKSVFDDRIPVIDHMWQTETGGPIVGNPYGLGLLPIKPGSSGILLPGIEGAVVTQAGEPCEPGERGLFVVAKPFPGLTATLWGESERYGPEYWDRIPGFYCAGDAATVDEDGYVWFGGRVDEVINVSAHRIGAIEVETAFLRHPAVGEAGVTGRPDALRGEVIAAFVVLKHETEPSPELKDELLQTVRRELGAVAVVGELNFVRVLPKTRSGKIMRRVLKAVVLDNDPGDISTIEDEGSVDEAREVWEQMKAELAR